MTVVELLLCLRLFEIAFLFACLWWVYQSPVSVYRRLRLITAWVLVGLNLIAIGVAVGIAKVTLW